jgi:hypothetical protein
MSALLLADLNGNASPLTRRSLSGNSASASSGASPVTSYSEHWLRDLLFRHPELLVVDRLGFEEVVPLCREFALPRAGSSVFADILGVTRTGRLAAVECKLWRNPQARREVVAQILEYAALLRRWSFADLTTGVRRRVGGSEPNPIFAMACARWPDLDEAAFVDAIARSLKLGDFQLIVAGDGIRSDIHAIAEHLYPQIAGLAQLALLEVQLWHAADGTTLVVPTIPFRTEVIQQRVLVSASSGVPLEIETDALASATDEAMESVVDPDQVDRRAKNRAFWQRFIEQVQFDHPDQPPPRHGGDNWVKIGLPEPVGRLTVFRSTGPRAEVGLFMTFRDRDGEPEMFETLAGDLEQLRSESGLNIVARTRDTSPFWAEIGVFRPRAEVPDDDVQLAWLCDAANRIVSSIRPRLTVLAEAAE